MAFGAGLLMALAFPKPGVAGFAWVGPGLMLMAALGCEGAAAFRIGYAGGLGFYLGALSWLLWIPVSFTPIGGWLALSAYLALYPAIWVWLSWKLYPAPALPEEGEGEAVRSTRGMFDLLDRFLATAWWQRLGWSLVCAALWVGLEMIVGRLFTGFPWLYLGVSQYRMLPLIQIAAVTGVYGVSFLVVWFSVSLAGALIMLLRRPGVRWHSQREVIAPFLVGAAVVAAGWGTIMRPTPPQATVKVALVQPSIPQTWIWDAKESSNRFRQLIQLSQQALTNHPDLLVWPEAAVPDIFKFGDEFNGDIYEPMTNLVQTHKVWLALGGDEAEVRARGNGRLETNWFNSSFLINPEGDVTANYRKRQLVVFGEYVPFGRRFPIIEAVTGLGSFTRGNRPGFFRIPELRLKAGVLICFEDAFPHVTRTSVDDETDFLLNLTNNGWFGESSAQWQHAANAVFRAIENGLPLVRCANNGLTCWVDAQGRMDSVFFPGTKDIYGIGYKIVEVPLLDGSKRVPTFYHRQGDRFGWACVGLSLALVLRHFIRGRAAIPANKSV